MFKLTLHLIFISVLISVVFTKPQYSDQGLRKILQDRVPSFNDGIVNFWGKKVNFHNYGGKLNVEEVETKYFPQKIDHYDPNDNRTFQMRYFERLTLLKDGGPMFIVLGGEWPIDTGEALLADGPLSRFAEEHGGALFVVEHRFYGESFPFEESTVENYAYLNLGQVLADYAYFIEYAKKTYPSLEYSKAIVIGASYSAALASWMRLKYPDLVAGAWSSSPSNENVLELPEYKEIVGEAMTFWGGSECTDIVKAAFDEIEELVLKNTTEKIEQYLPVCGKIDTSDIRNTWTLVHGVFAVVTLIVNDLPSEYTVQTCDFLKNPAFEEPLEAVGQYMQLFFPEGGCMKTNYKNYIDYLSHTEREHPSNSANRQWLWTVCNEFGYFLTSDSPNQPFGTKVPGDLWINMCNDIFKPGFTRQNMEASVRRTRLMYGGYEAQFRNVVTSVGTLDGWRQTAPQRNVNEDSPTVFLENASHCNDFLYTTFPESENIKEFLKILNDNIKKWIR